MDGFLSNYSDYQSTHRQVEESVAEEQKTLLIADDHPIFRQGMKQILEPVKWLRIVAEAESGDSALTQIKYLKPDLAILDLAMPGMDGLEVLEQARLYHPDMIATIVTSYDDKAYLDRALELGARAYVVKDGAAENMVHCLEAVRRGEIYISPSLGGRTPKLPRLDIGESPSLDLLTETERIVLAEVAQFQTSKEIARELGVSYRTIQNHRANICAKLDLKGSHQLMSFAREHSEMLKT